MAGSGVQAQQDTLIFGGSGFATRVIGGDLPGQSGRTAHSWLGCVSETGVQNQNHLVNVDLGGVVEVSGSTTTNQSVERPNGARGSITVNEVASVEIGDPSILGLTLEGVRSEARAFQRPDGSFTRGRDWSVGSANLVIGGVSVPVDISDLLTPEGIEVPGIATVRGGLGGGSVGPDGSRAGTTGLRIDLLDLGGEPAQVIVSRSFAKIDRIDGHPTAGFAYAADLDVLDGVFGLGRIANQPVPCEGTGGEWRQNSTAGVDVPGVIDLGAATSRTRTFDGPNGGTNVFAESHIADVSLLGGDLQIEGIDTRAHVRKRPDGTRLRSSDGTAVARITVAGDEIELPSPGETVELIPGVVEITIGRVIHQPRGMRVIGVEVRLLEGDVTVLELGHVRGIVH